MTKKKKEGRIVSAAADENPADAIVAHSGADEDHSLVVCFGASAGGLEPLKQIFDHMPADTKMTFVVITHLQPDKQSALPEILNRAGVIRFVEATDHMPLEPNQAYTLPPAKIMQLEDGKLRLAKRPRNDGRTPIDDFLISLASTYGPRSVAVILSGTGHDGRDGAAVVRAAQGLVIAQDPRTARFEGMPRAVIDNQAADHILPPNEIVQFLIEHQRALQDDGGIGDRLDVQARRAIEHALRIVRERTGRDFSHYKESSVFRRINRRRRMVNAPTLDAYVERLESNPDEVNTLASEILIGVTSFFRDTHAFEVLKQAVIRPLIESKNKRAPLRVWLPGVGTGQEAFSIAIVIHECLSDLKRNLGVQIFATDVNPEAIDQARTGRFPVSIENEMSPERLSRYFVRDGDGFRTTREIREWLVFAVQDVTQDPAFTRMDLIVCRNLFIYLDAAMQKRLLAAFHYALNSGGYLFLGSSETVGEMAHLFETLDSGWKIFRRKDVAPTRGLTYLPTRGAGPPDRPTAGVEMEQQIKEAIEKDLLDAFVPAGVVVDSHGEIYYFHGRTGKYLEPAPGRPHLNVLEMAREGLAAYLPGLLRGAHKERLPVSHTNLLVKIDGESKCIDVRVEPMLGGRRTEGLFRILFTESTAQATTVQVIPTEHIDAAVEDRLEQELARTKQDLYATIEEFQTANEDLRSTNEEYQSANEELQSANEELETSREEMQSLNEELSTVNDELEQKVLSLTQAQEEMTLYLNCLEIPTIFLDQDLRIERFTRQAVDVVNVISSDNGRPIFHISNKLVKVDLLEHARRVLDTMHPEEKQVQRDDGRWYLMRVLPYSGEENNRRWSGIVISFIDIHALKQDGKQ